MNKSDLPRMKLIIFSLFIAFASGNHIKASIETLTNLNTQIRNLLTNNPRFIGGFVRLSFHDCVGEGRCDGCIDHTNHDNNGLKVYTDVLNELYSSVSSSITRADLYAFAGIVAANFGSASREPFDVNRFKVGRHDCSATGDETQSEEPLPGNNMQNVAEIHQFFEGAFGLTLRESVAIMGAHSLGRMRTVNSGYEGAWVRGAEDPNILDNKYYDEVVNAPWFLKVMPTDANKHQWQINPPSLGVGNSATARAGTALLNSDAALAVNLFLNKETGAFQTGTECVMCPPNRRNPRGANGLPCCNEDTVGRPICVEYINSNGQWMRDFEDAFYKMIDNPQDDLSSPVAAPATEAPTQATEAPTPATEAPTPATEAPTPATEAPTTRPSGGRGGRGGRGGGRQSGGRRGDAKVLNSLNKVLENLKDVMGEIKKIKKQ